MEVVAIEAYEHSGQPDINYNLEYTKNTTLSSIPERQNFVRDLIPSMLLAAFVIGVILVW